MVSLAPLTRAVSAMTCEVDKFCCCSLRAGVLFVSSFFLVNACLAFAGEAALFLGLLSSLSGGLPPGTKLDDPRIHGAVIVIGLWSLAGAICGFLASLRKSIPGASGFYVVAIVDFVLGLLIQVISWFLGANFNVLLGQVPSLLLNAYFVVVVRSFRLALLRQASEVEAGGAPSAGAGGDEEGVLGGDELELDEEDLDLELGEAAPAAGAGSGSSKAQVSAETTPVKSNQD